MKKISYHLAVLLVALAFHLPVFGQSTSLSQQVNDYIQNVQQRHGIPGATVAIVKNGKVIHRNNYGYANLEHQVPITDNSIFRLYSLTKPLVAVAIFQLAEAGKLSLDDRVDQYFTELPPTWNSLQIKHLLTHSSGLPDMAPIPVFENLTEEEAKEKVFSEPITFAAGTEYAYNQTNFWLLQQIIEQLSGESMSDFIIKNQFSTPVDTVFFSSDSRDIVRHRVTPYFPFRNGKQIIDHSYLQGDYAWAMNGLNITLNEFLNWDARLRNNELLNAKTKEKMWQEFPYTKKPFPFAYSWESHTVNKHPSFGFSGSLVTAYRTFPDDDLSIMFFANGLGNYFNIENIVNHLASLVDEDIVDPNNLVFESLLQTAMKEDMKAVRNTYTQLKKTYPKVDFESQINAIGYMLMNVGQLPKAIEVFTFNTQQFPTSWNVFDSLGEAYLQNNNLAKAKKYYEQSLQLNPANKNGEKMLGEITKRKQNN